MQENIKLLLFSGLFLCSENASHRASLTRQPGLNSIFLPPRHLAAHLMVMENMVRTAHLMLKVWFSIEMD